MDEPKKLKVNVHARTWTNIGLVKRVFSVSSISVWRDQNGVSIELEGTSQENLNARTKFRLSAEESKALAQLLFAVNHEA